MYLLSISSNSEIIEKKFLPNRIEVAECGLVD